MKPDAVSESSTSLTLRSQVDPVRVVIQQIYGEQKIVVTELKRISGAIVIFPIERFGLHNAKLLNADGSIRADIEIPNQFQNGIGFSDAYYVLDELAAIFVESGRDFAFVVDETSGRVIRSMKQGEKQVDDCAA